MKKLATASMVLFCLCAFTQAATLSQTETFSGVPNLSADLAFNQWDSSWGTLNSILIELEITANGGALRVDNDSGSPSSSSVEFGAEGNLFSSDIWLFNAASQPIYAGDVVAATSDSMTLSADDGDAEVGGTPNFSFSGADYGSIVGGETTSSDSDYVGSSWWNFAGRSYIGSGTFVITANIDQHVDLGTISGAQQQIDPLTAEGFVRVIYDYDGEGPPGPPPNVPEPATVSLIGVVSAVGLILRRRGYRSDECGSSDETAARKRMKIERRRKHIQY